MPKTLAGKCENCGLRVNKLLDADGPRYADGTRYIYPDLKKRPEGNYNIFRCKGCGVPITESWICIEDATKQ